MQKRTPKKLLIISLFFLLNAFLTFAQGVKTTVFPSNFQLFPRNVSTNLAALKLSGEVEQSSGYGKIGYKLYKNGILLRTDTKDLYFNGSSAFFNFETSINAELSNYSIELYATKGVQEVLIKKAEKIVAGDVYLVNGQSNAIGAAYEQDWDEFSRSFTYQYGWNLINFSFPSKWAGRIAKDIIKNNKVPVLIFNEAEGSQQLTFFLKNQASPDLGNYGALKKRVEAAGISKQQVRAVFWYQGESDGWETPINEYKANLKTLFNDWVADYGIEKCYLYQIRYKSCSHPNPSILEVQRQLSTEIPNVRIMSTSNAAHDGCHFEYYGGYDVLADRMYGLVAKDLYATPATDVEAPAISNAYISGTNELTLAFSNINSLNVIGLPWGDFKAEGVNKIPSSGEVVGNTLKLRFAENINKATGISYLAHSGSANHWLVNSKNVGALSFYNFPLSTNNSGGGGANPPSTTNYVDLELKATSNPTALKTYEPLTITLVLSNKGNIAANKVVVNAPIIDGQFAFIRNTETAGSHYDYWNGMWYIDRLEANQEVSIAVEVYVLNENNSSKFFEVTAQAEKDIDSTPNNKRVGEDDEFTLNLSKQGATSGGGNTSTAFASDLAVSISSTQSSFSLFREIPLSITVKNTGTEALQQIAIALDAIPQTAYVRHAAVLGDLALFCNDGALCPNFKIPLLLPNQEATLQLVVFVNAPKESLTFNAVATFSVPEDKNLANNSASVTLTQSSSLLFKTKNLDNTNNQQVVSVFPNPTSDKLNVSLVSNENMEMNWELFDSTGKLVRKGVEIVFHGGNNVQIDMSELKSGIYFFKIISEQRNDAIRLIKH